MGAQQILKGACFMLTETLERRLSFIIHPSLFCFSVDGWKSGSSSGLWMVLPISPTCWLGGKAPSKALPSLSSWDLSLVGWGLDLR